MSGSGQIVGCGTRAKRVGLLWARDGGNLLLLCLGIQVSSLNRGVSQSGLAQAVPQCRYVDNWKWPRIRTTSGGLLQVLHIPVVIFALAMTSTGSGWAQLRQQARSLETQVCTCPDPTEAIYPPNLD